MPAYSVIFSVMAYSHILRHYQGIFRRIQTYTAPCITLEYSQPYHILSPGIFRTGGSFKTLWNEQAYSELCHWKLFNHIQAYSEPRSTLAYAEPWNTRNPDSEPFHNCIPTHIQSPVIFTKIYEYSKLWPWMLCHIQKPTHIPNPLKDLRWSFWQK